MDIPEEPSLPQRPQFPMRQLTRQERIDQAYAMIAWCNEMILAVGQSKQWVVDGKSNQLPDPIFYQKERLRWENVLANLESRGQGRSIRTAIYRGY